MSDFHHLDFAVADGVVYLRGEIDMLVAPDLAEVIARLIASGQTTIDFDLADVTFIDSSGLGAILYAVSEGAQVQVRNPQGRTVEVLRMIGLEDLLNDPTIIKENP